MRFEAPATTKTAFNCPHCNALAAQSWFECRAEGMGPQKTPTFIDLEAASTVVRKDHEDDAQWEKLKRFIDDLQLGGPIFEQSSSYTHYNIHHMHLARCFNCRAASVWIDNKLIYPPSSDAPIATEDMPADVKRDYTEAAEIVNLSPRGAAALLRLSLQRLCKHLGGDGRDINKDIGSLVAKGLDTRIQMALDVVRVVGNNAVHPGQIAIDDDRSVAFKLFGLINLIVEKMISEPKHINALFENLPEGARKGIEQRDKSRPS
ncbi:DUF4145 domain-containing protein [Aureimonas flava]|uniref:DUF4145 domain-containing protein n=1 Tax=Aureimonas flava TaxID=2320271 RepID=A0A3A1WM90_9HYPH|nr:DUF4145 domain-containing protein [Aureimonas flava]RIY01486.1 DUF4145 domain-containing protein [Aureimonas flava]